MPTLNWLAAKPFDAGRTYADVVHFVHVYVMEPHPSVPDLSPYQGLPSEVPTSRPQPRSYDQRLSYAIEVATGWIEDNQLLLVDDLPPLARTNPLWCTYGPSPNAGFLIDQRGVLREAHVWVDVGKMATAIDSLVAE